MRLAVSRTDKFGAPAGRRPMDLIPERGRRTPTGCLRLGLDRSSAVFTGERLPK